jgi:Zn-dependent metalloprotease
MSAEGINTAAQNHLDGIFGKRQEIQPSARAVVTRNYAPQLVQTTTQVSNFTKTRQVHVVCFHQTHRAIPIFGTRAVVEVDDSGKLIAAQAKLANVTGVAPTAALTPDKASATLAGLLKLAPKNRKELSKQETSLTFFHDRPSDKWHLAYLFRDIPALPPKAGTPATAAEKKIGRHGHGLAGDPRQRFPRLDYLLDANSGEIVYYYSVSPTAARKAPNPLPARLKGLDDEGNARMFFGMPNKDKFLLHDPTRFIRTHDLKGGSIDTAEIPRNPVSSAKFDFASSNTAAISAHVNSGFVFDFYNSVLIRRGVDDQGMEVVNVVNCTSPQDERPPQWGNAVWWNKKMWYGQMIDGPDKRRSFARYLDVIGHELTHGVTETTSNLVYRDEAGALNESFSDIFGVIINNWTKRRGVDARKWDWEIGSGLGDKPGNPLRNMKNPKITGDPAHTNEMLTLKPGEQPSDDNDFGFVHTNSNIHNKAAFNVLTATAAGAKGKNPPLVFDPEDVARLYYFTLQRLDRVATFEDVYFTLLDVARTMYPDPDEQTAKLAALTKAYADVGIPRAKGTPAVPAKPKAGAAKKPRGRTKAAKRSVGRRR